MAKTGIVCTIGPAIRSIEILKKLVGNGMTTVRFNFSHVNPKDYEKDFALIKTLNEECDKKVEILVDLAGHRIRIGDIKGNQMELKKGQKLILTNKEIIGDHTKISIDYENSLTDIENGLDVLIDDGNLTLKVLSSKKDEVVTEVQNDYILKSRKGVNIPQAKLHFPVMEKKDRDDMIAALEHNADFIANSFVRDANDMLPLIEILKEKNNTTCKLIAKIEDASGINNLGDILNFVDGVMVARGDLGVTLPLWKIPLLQKYIINQCKARNKFTITATQMLESMIKNPKPTRAEVCDVANAVLDGSDYVMLSAETAVGQYPDKAVEMMGNIIRFTEENLSGLNGLK